MPPEVVEGRRFSPVVAGLLSLLIPGAGQAYLGQRTKAALVLVGAVVTGCLCGLVNLFAALDAWDLARRANRGEELGPWTTSRLADAVADLF